MLADVEYVKTINLYFDKLLLTSPFTVKTCKRYTIDNSHSNNVRTGRFILYEKQHTYLVNNNGYYIFVVSDTPKSQPCKVPTSKPKVSHVFIIPARNIKPKIKGSKALTWTLLKNLP